MKKKLFSIRKYFFVILDEKISVKFAAKHKKKVDNWVITRVGLGGQGVTRAGPSGPKARPGPARPRPGRHAGGFEPGGADNTNGPGWEKIWRAGPRPGFLEKFYKFFLILMPNFVLNYTKYSFPIIFLSNLNKNNKISNFPLIL